jgi:hypothetical protein
MRSAKRRYANVWAVGLSHEIVFIPSAECVIEHEGSTEVCVSGCEADVGLGGVIGHGTHEEDGPVTWETLVSPQ